MTVPPENRSADYRLQAAASGPVAGLQFGRMSDARIAERVLVTN